LADKQRLKGATKQKTQEEDTKNRGIRNELKSGPGKLWRVNRTSPLPPFCEYKLIPL